jgi:hypothetical protein
MKALQDEGIYHKTWLAMGAFLEKEGQGRIEGRYNNIDERWSYT